MPPRSCGLRFKLIASSLGPKVYSRRVAAFSGLCQLGSKSTNPFACQRSGNKLSHLKVAIGQNSLVEARANSCTCINEKAVNEAFTDSSPGKMMM